MQAVNQATKRGGSLGQTARQWDSDWRADLFCLSDRRVRDLAWLIGSPPLLQLSTDRAYWPASQQWQDWLQDSWPWIQALDEQARQQPDVLPKPHKRIGLYAQDLFQCWLQHTGELLAADLQVRYRQQQKGKGQQTITAGAFDFLHKPADQAKGHPQPESEQLGVHWELALKFYLQDGSLCWGPGRNDRLDFKVQRLCQRQLRLTQHEAARQQLAQWPFEFAPAAALKGRIYYPQRGQQSPEWATAEHLRGYWYRLSEAQALPLYQLDWLLLEKRDWLSPVLETDRSDWVWLDKTGLQITTPLCVAAMAEGREQQRFFLVPDDWNEQ